MSSDGGASSSRLGGIADAFEKLLGNIAVWAYRRPWGALAIASLFFSLALFPPLRLAAGLYFLLVRRADARWTAAWIAGTQAAAHVTALAFLGLPLTLHLWVPIAVGGLWGAWLPRVKPPEIS